MKRIVVIGGSAAGMTAAINAARQNPDIQIIVVTQDKIPYRRPAIPALIAGHIDNLEGAKIFTEQVIANYNIKLICPAKAVKIDTKAKTILIESNGKKEMLPFDAAVIATGSIPIIPKIPGADKKGVCTFTTYEAATEIVELVKTATSAAIIGAGFIALEIAEALMHKGLDVYFNVRSRILRKLLEPELSDFLNLKFEQQGLKMLTGQAISEITGDSHVEYVIYNNQKVPADIVIMGAGVKPNVTLAEDCGIEPGSTGAIKVDNHMQTSIKDIYAVGDCAESPDLALGNFVYMPVGSIAAYAAKIAGANAAGANQKTAGFLRAQADEILGLQIFSIGHSTTTAKELGIKVNVYDLTAPESQIENQTTKPFEKAKILTNAEDKIIGAQLIAQRHGAQFASQLYKAVLDNVSRDEFLKQFHSPRMKFAETLLNSTDSCIQVEKIEKNKALKLTDKTTK